MGRDYLTTCVTSRATPSSCDGGEGEAQFPMERGLIAKHHQPAWNPQCTRKSRKVLCPKPKVMPRFSHGDVGEARWLLWHRWTETIPISGQIFHTIAAINDALFALSVLSACVRHCQLHEAHHNLQQALAHGRRAHLTDGSPAHL